MEKKYIEQATEALAKFPELNSPVHLVAKIMELEDKLNDLATAARGLKKD